MAMMDNSLRSAVNPVARIALPWLAVIVAAIFSGTLAAGNANSVLGQKPALLLLGALVAGSFCSSPRSSFSSPRSGSAR